MKKIYFTRHGQTIWNVENKICGATDIALTDLGHEQAMALGRKLIGLPIEQILSSPLSRAKDTAAHISEITGVPMRLENLLTEQNFGKYETEPRDSKEFQNAKKQFANRFETGESMLMVARRIYTLLDTLAKDDKVYLLVAHNGIARIVHSYFYDMGNEEFAKFSLQNCEFREYHFPAQP